MIFNKENGLYFNTFHTLTHYLKQVDMFIELEWKCPKDNMQYKKIVEKERIFTFLFRLNKNLDEVGKTYPTYSRGLF